MKLKHLHIDIPALLIDLIDKNGYSRTKLIIKLLMEYFKLKEEEVQ
jgi:hypothetical protein